MRFTTYRSDIVLPCLIPVSPNLCTIFSVSSLPKEAAPEYGVDKLVTSYWSTRGLLARKLTIGGAIRENVHCKQTY